VGPADVYPETRHIEINMRCFRQMPYVTVSVESASGFGTISRRMQITSLSAEIESASAFACAIYAQLPGAVLSTVHQALQERSTVIDAGGRPTAARRLTWVKSNCRRGHATDFN